ncbi:Outer membrane protein H precursor [Anaerovibrio sp. JC8]|uniref:OmpH family outer membrane protein n=1 Tax=Anaerovibrio sp. JC8 TaxID=1240085 RepID=UPI000A0E7B0E|nr:OmpH family outer membrane protein [Anaerovibrio sp. JC8]ORU00955.1 Outer membrane protein H precursor [Anaerovibrio sp. JC8]
MVQLKKTQVKIISVLIALVFVGSVVALALSQSNSSIANAAASSNVGVVDYSQFGSIKDVTDMQAQMQQLTNDAQKDFEEKSAGMNDQQKAEYYQQTMQRLQQQQMDMMEPVRNKIEAAVKEVADAKGITVVLNKEAVVYGGTDLTQDVLKKLNK